MKNNNTHTSFPDCLEQLDDARMDQYRREGFIAFENALSPDEVAEARQAISDIVQRYAFQESRSVYKPSTGENGNYTGASFHSRSSRCGISLEAGMEPSPDDIDAIEGMVRKLMWFDDEAEIFRHICGSHPRIQGVVKSILGPEVELFQSMALIKPAFHGSEKPWHQDNAYFSVQDLDRVLGTWIALDDVTVENGAMHFLSGAHREGPLKHEHTTDCEIVKDRYCPEEAVPVNLKAGGMVFFHGNAPHFTPPNRTANRRRALQFHYRAADNPKVAREDYDRIFTEADGSPASCAAARPENF